MSWLKPRPTNISLFLQLTNRASCKDPAEAINENGARERAMGLKHFRSYRRGGHCRLGR